MAYQAPGLSAYVVNDIPDLFFHPKAKVLPKTLTGQKFMCKLPGGQIYYDSKLDLDTDGSSAFAAQDPTGQSVTSAKYDDGTSLDSNITNFFVLPGGFPAKHNIRLGDIAVVIYGIRTAYACFGDVGPQKKLGEGSISLHRELGHETIRNGNLINAGISRDVITIVFPGTGNGFGISNSESERIGKHLFQELLAEAASWAKTLDGIEKRRMGYQHDPFGISDDGWVRVKPLL